MRRHLVQALRVIVRLRPQTLGEPRDGKIAPHLPPQPRGAELSDIANHVIRDSERRAVRSHAPPVIATPCNEPESFTVDKSTRGRSGLVRFRVGVGYGGREVDREPHLNNVVPSRTLKVECEQVGLGRNAKLLTAPFESEFPQAR